MSRSNRRQMVDEHDAVSNDRWRWASVLGLLLMAPVTAEYLGGYDDSTGDLVELLGGLFLFLPLYGGAAVLVREVARRIGGGWPVILLLGAAFGVAQAGLIDHSMFNPNYRDIEGWPEIFRDGYVGSLGINPNLTVGFATGHMIWSVAAPIALVEALSPRRRLTPWLRWPGLVVVTALFLAGAAAVVQWHFVTEEFRPAPGQLARAVLIIAVLIAAALAVAWRARAHTPRPAKGRPTVAPVVAALAPFSLFALRSLGGSELGVWWELAAAVITLATLGALLLRWSRRAGWGPAHHLAVTAGTLLSSIAVAFAARPLGDVDPIAKYAHNTIALIGVVALVAIAARRCSPSERSTDHTAEATR